MVQRWPAEDEWYVDGVVTGKPLYWSPEGKRLKRKPPESVLGEGSSNNPSLGEPSSQEPKIISARKVERVSI